MIEMEDTAVFDDMEILLSDHLIRESITKKYIIDASVVFKWYYKKGEKDLEKAKLLYGLLNSKDSILLAPELLVYEVLNILRLKKEISAGIVNNIISELYDVILFVAVDSELFSKAFAFSRDLDVSFYDSIYIALSVRYSAPLITADNKLYRSGRNISQKPLLLSELDSL
jgi:predicted nucleic acid-binding protein